MSVAVQTIRQSYWHDSIEAALYEAGIEFSDSQLSEVVQSLEVSLENESLATGRDCIPSPIVGQLARERADRKATEEQMSANREVEGKELRETIRILRRRILTLEREAQS